MGTTLTIRLPEHLAEALGKASRETGLAKGDIVRQAVAAHLKRAGAPTVMQRHFGTMRGPVDLSTNKTYRRAWTKKRR
jgi:hypothetical protein